MIYIFDWISELIEGIGDSLSSSLSSTWESVSSSIWETFMTWLYSLVYSTPSQTSNILLNLLLLIALGYCVIRCFFSNIKRGGILLTQIAVGSLYLFSLPRGYSDGFLGWCKQIIAICFTTFMQTTLLLMGLITMQTHPLLGLGVMLASNEVPRIAQQYGLDTSTKVNVMGAVHTTTSAINLGKTILHK